MVVVDGSTVVSFSVVDTDADFSVDVKSFTTELVVSPTVVFLSTSGIDVGVLLAVDSCTEVDGAKVADVVAGITEKVDW